MRPVLFLLLLLLSFGSVRAQGQSGPAKEQDEQLLFTAHHYGMDAGLPHRSVTALAQDDRGFLWVGTPRGLARFDGYDFRVHSMATGLSGNNVVNLESDRDGMLWVLYENGKLDIMDPRSGRVKTLQDYFAGRLPQEATGPFKSMSASQEGDIVFSKDDYLILFQGTQKPFDVMQVDCHDRLEVLLVSNLKEAWCQCLAAGPIWESLTLTRVPFQVPHEGRAQKLLRVATHTICPQVRDLSGWRASRDVGMYYRNLKGVFWTPTEEEVFHGNERPPAAPTTWAYGYFFAPLTDDVWLVNTTVRRMKAGDNPFAAPVLFDLNAIYPEAGFTLGAALRDRTGNLWAGGEFGLYKINMQPAFFQHMLQDTLGRKGPGYRVRGMVVTGGRVHVNTELRGYWVLDASTGAVISKEANGELRQMMIGDGHGGLWRAMGTDLLHADANGKVDRTVRAPLGTLQPWSALTLKDGGLLVGTVEGMRFAGAHDDSMRVCLYSDPRLDHAWVWYLMYDRNDNLLACTNAGLFRLDEHGQVLERWWSGAMQDKDTAHYLPADDIRYCHVDPEGIYWLGTSSNGLLRWDRTTGEVRGLGTRDGIPDASIHAILPDAEGVLWLPTDNGLVRYDPVSGASKTFTTNDGLPSNEFNRLAYAQGPDGRFYLGGLNGIAAFDPKELHSPTEVSLAPLVIGGVYKQLAENQGQKNLTAQVLDGGAIMIDPDDRYFSVEMVLLSYEDPSQIRYAWRIEGIDDEWNVQSEPQLRFNALPFGDHVLQVKAMDAKGRWTEAGLSIPITMVPPIHLRWWFILGAILLAVLITFAMVRYRERQLMQVIRMRDHIASDLHDEVGSTLSSIVLFSSAVGKRNEALSQDAKNMLNRIKDNSTRAMESMNDIVWSVNSDHDTMENLVDRMRAYAQPLCESADIDLKFVLGSGMGMRKLGMEERKNIYLIFKEAVSNAVKHARCTVIIVHFRQVGGKLELVVLDNGIGIITRPADRLRLGGNGVGNMNRRAKELGGELRISDQPEGGTRIEFRS